MRLADFQAAFALGLRTGSMPDQLVALVRGDGLAPAARLNIHRNHVRTTLREALALHFPVVRRLLGETAFAAVANRFVAAHPPADPRLALFGAGFPAFLAAEAALAAFPMVAEAGAFEWARHRASLAPEAVPLDGAGLAAVPPDRLDGLALSLHPSVSLIAAAHAVEHLWHINQPGSDGTPTQPIDVACRLVVWRDGMGLIRVASLDPPDAAFLHGVAAGHGLADALAAVLNLDDGADLGLVIGRALGRGLLCLRETQLSTGEWP